MNKRISRKAGKELSSLLNSIACDKLFRDDAKAEGRWHEVSEYNDKIQRKALRLYEDYGIWTAEVGFSMPKDMRLP